MSSQYPHPIAGHLSSLLPDALSTVKGCQINIIGSQRQMTNIQIPREKLEEGWEVRGEFVFTSSLNVLSAVSDWDSHSHLEGSKVQARIKAEATSTDLNQRQAT